MDVIDEKQNGTPTMEIDEVVSVRDRERPTSCEYALDAHLVSFVRRSFCC